jgi:hypothetical protein
MHYGASLSLLVCRYILFRNEIEENLIVQLVIMFFRISIEEFMIELPEFFVRDLEEVFDIECSVTVTVFTDQVLIECE